MSSPTKAALLLGALSFGFPTAAAQKDTASDIAKNHVDVLGGLSASQVQQGDSVRFWVTVDNGLDSELSDVTIRLDVSKNVFVPTCEQVSSDPQVCGPIQHVFPGQSITFQGRLHCLDSTEPSIINAKVSFDSLLKNTAIHSDRIVSLGPLVGRSPWLEFVTTYKELLLPLVVTIFGLYFTSRQAKVQTERAEVGETWNKMLPISHKLAMGYYLPMMRPLLRVLRDIRNHKEKEISVDFATSSVEERSIFFHLVFFWWYFNTTQNIQGGIYFKNRVGEKIVLTAFLKFRDAYKREGLEFFEVEKRIKSIHKELKSTTEFPDFEEIILGGTNPALSIACNAGWADFRTWYLNENVRTEGVSRLSLFQKVMEFEANRPYQRWYNSPERLELNSDDKDTLMRLAESPTEKIEYSDYFRCAIEERWS